MDDAVLYWIGSLLLVGGTAASLLTGRTLCWRGVRVRSLIVGRPTEPTAYWASTGLCAVFGAFSAWFALSSSPEHGLGRIILSNPIYIGIFAVLIVGNGLWYWIAFLNGKRDRAP